MSLKTILKMIEKKQNVELLDVSRNIFLIFQTFAT